jgi:Polyketide cyclase / dehydrase and lipid transport
VWQLIGDARAWSDWGAWSSVELLREGSPPPGGVHAVKRLKSFPTSVVEEVTVFDPPRKLGYEMRSGLPLRGYRAAIELEPAGGVTRIRWHAEFEPKLPGTGAFYRRVLSAFTADAVARLASAAERL